MGELIVRPLAEADVRDAAFWYESKREGLGAEFALELDAVYERIAENPRKFPEIEEGTRRGELLRIANVEAAALNVVPEMYERRGFRPAWTSPAAIDDLLTSVREIGQDGLDPADYHLGALEQLRAEADRNPGDANVRADLDVLLTDSLTRLAYHLFFGKVDARASTQTGISRERSAPLTPLRRSRMRSIPAPWRRESTDCALSLLHTRVSGRLWRAIARSPSREAGRRFPTGRP